MRPPAAVRPATPVRWPHVSVGSTNPIRAGGRDDIGIGGRC